MSVPPLFGNFGKSTTDLFKKKFEFDPIQLKSIQKSKANGVSVENGAVAVLKQKDGKEDRYLRGYNKFSLARASFGSADLELHTDASQTSKVQVKLTKLHPGLAVTLIAASLDKAPLFVNDKLVASVEATYNRPYVNTELKLKTDLAVPKLKVDGSASFAVHDNVSVGASFSASHDGKDKALTRLETAELGAEYSQNDLTVSVFTNTESVKNVPTQFVNGSYFQNISRDFTQGAAWKYNLAAKTHEVTLGSDVRLGPDTGLKSKLLLPKGTWQLAVEQRLANPQLLLGVATEFDVATPYAPASKQFGVSLTFGDF